MRSFDYFIGAVLTIVMIVGGYQFYFLPQKNRIKAPLSFETKIDRKIPFRPYWVWVYSGLYYPILVFLIFTVDSFSHFMYTAFSFICLLFMHILISFIFPVKTPPDWRIYNKNESISTKFLSIVHHYDEGSNCFPSMHVAVAVLTSLHLAANLSNEWSYLSHLFPILIAVSTLFTKQHYILDIPGGIILGVLNFELFLLIFRHFG